MKLILRTAAAGLAIASFGIASSSASAATTAEAGATAEILTSLSVEVVALDDTLNFGSLSDGGVVGSVNVVLGADGLVSSCGANLLCGGTPDSPTFVIKGADDAIVDLSFVNASEPLTHSAGAATGTMMASAFTTSEVGDEITLDGNGDGSFSIGGTLEVSAGQAAGVYTGEVNVQVAYQ